MRLSDTSINNCLQNGAIEIQSKKDIVLGENLTGVTVDLTLSGEFVALKELPPGMVTNTKETSGLYEPKVNLEPGEEYILNPGTLVLAATDESITIHDTTLLGWLDGKSSLARMGIMVHLTAHRIDPGWSGKIVLEILNTSANRYALKVGGEIAALSFERIEGDVAYPYTERKDSSYKHQESVLLPNASNEGI